MLLVPKHSMTEHDRQCPIVLRLRNPSTDEARAFGLVAYGFGWPEDEKYPRVAVRSFPLLGEMDVDDGDGQVTQCGVSREDLAYVRHFETDQVAN